MPNDLQYGRKLIGGRWIRWNERIAAQAYSRGLWTLETLANKLRHAARDTPQRVLVIDGDHRIDCQSMHIRANNLAQALLAKVPTGSVVSFMLPNWHEAAVIYLGATLAGMVVNPILPSLRDRELLFILKDVHSSFVFVPSTIGQMNYVSMLSRVVAQMDTPPEVVVLRGEAGDYTAYESLLQSSLTTKPLPIVNPDAVRMVMYTSGTTGRAKGVMHTHNTLHALIRQLGTHWLIERGDKFLVPSPIGHIGGSIYTFECPLLLGTTAVLMDRWNADEAVELMESERCTHMAGATPFLTQLLAAAERAETHLPSLKVFICGGASVPASLIRRATAYLINAIITRVYGSTEVPVTTVGVTSRNDAKYAAETDGCIGLADIKLINNKAVADGGEICVRGPQMFVGYIQREDDATSFDADGYFQTGDLGRWVDTKYLVVTGRAKDIIIRNGENISPREVEDLLMRHPNVAEIAIVGLPDARTGERACAVIVPQKLPGPDAAELLDFLQSQGMATFKAPEQVVIWDALPKNDAGKVVKQQLRAKLTDQI